MKRYTSHTIYIFLGNGDGTFAPRVNYETGNEPMSITSGDFNRDGEMDLATSNSWDRTISILLGGGDGTFAVPVNYETGSAPYDINNADFNGDGILDLAVSNAMGLTNYDYVSIFIGNGDGTFAPPMNYALGEVPRTVSIGDFNGDGNLDLAIPNYYAHSISILMGRGDGTFNVRVDYVTGSYPLTALIGDFNSDSILDIVVPNVFDQTISILTGKGDGTFNVRVPYYSGVGNNINGAGTGDFNLDGKPDIVTVQPDIDGNVNVIQGNADGTFSSIVNYKVGNQPLRVFSGDFNGDGKPDLAVSNWGGNSVPSVSILINTYNRPPIAEAGPDQSVNEGDTVTFSGSFIDADLDDTHTISWDFGDGSTDSGTLTPTHVYANSGVYTVTLTITDSGGGVGTDTLDITVKGLVAGYHLNGDTLDYSVNVNNGINHGAMFVDGISGQALHFDGSNEDPSNGKYVEILDNPSLDITDGLTIEAWIKIDAYIPGSHQSIVSKIGGPHVERSYSLILVPNSNDEENIIFWTSSSSDGQYPALMGPVIPLNAWVHVVGVKDSGSSSARIYLNGVLAASGNVQHPIYSGSAPVTIGANSLISTWDPPSPRDFFNGAIDEVAIYNRALSAEEINAEYHKYIPDAKANGPYVGNEGSAITFDASGSQDPDGHPLQYRWDFDNDGTWDTVWSSSSTASKTWNDDFSGGTVKVEVSDGKFTATDTATVTVNNVAPIIDAGSDLTINEGYVFNLAPATFSDPGTSDIHSATINWGDGTSLETGTVTESGGSGTVSGSHSYAKYGDYAVEVCVTDDDGASSCDTLELTVKDITPPVITINGDNPLTLVLGTLYVDPGATAIDNSDGTIPVTTTGSVNTASVGTYPVTYTATDFSVNTSTATRPVKVIYAPAGSMCLDAPGHEILQPINKDGTSVFKKGSTVPAKFRVCNANGNSVGASGVVSSFKLIQSKSGTVVNAVNEDVTSTTPDTAFRWEPTAQQWIFNINTKNLLASYTYTYRISLNDGTAIDFSFGLK